MDNPELMRLVVIVLFTLAAIVAVFVVISAFTGGDEDAESRLSNVTENRARKVARVVQAEQVATRRKAVADTLKDLDERQKSQTKVSLRVKLERAGLPISIKGFWIASVVMGAVSAVVLFLGLPPVHPSAYVAVAFIGTFGLPRWVVTKLTARRQAKFLDEFANAIDVIVRGVKSGLPLNECLGIIARESPSPVKEEFRELVEQQRVGITLSDAFDRMISRLPLAEVKFFAIVIGIQQQAGGNLSEALGNLSGVLRDRKRLQAKVRALSAEAKASAAVLGALPFVVMTLVYITTPDYISLLWKTQIGQLLLVAAGIWMTTGVLVMKKMINFKY